MSQDDGDPVSKQWTRFRAETDLDEYYERWRRLEATGKSPHGEADFIASLHPRSVLDAGEVPLSLDEYDGLCRAATVELIERWSTWDREPYRGGTYAVSVHRRPIEVVSPR